MLRFEPDRPAATPKDAATVVVVRATERQRVEIFCVKRHAASGFLGGAVVFPGGKLSGGDGASEWAALSTPLRPRARGVASEDDVARAFAVAALRELFEEAALLPLDGRELADTEVLDLRSELTRRVEATKDDAGIFRALIAERGYRLDLGRLEALSRWITPQAEPRRYDTRFYVMAAPAEQRGSHDAHETTSSFWADPESIVRLWERGEIFLAPPTIRTVQLFSQAQSVADCYRIAETQSLEPLCPHFAMDGELVVLALPGDPLYPEAVPPPKDETAPTRFVMRDGRFIPERVGRS